MAQNVLNTDYQMYGIYSAGDPNEEILERVYRTYQVQRVIVLDRNVFHRVQRRVQQLRLPIRVENYHMDPGNAGQAASIKENAVALVGNQPVLISCLHGRDRTGFLIASWLIKTGKNNPCDAIKKVNASLGYGEGLNDLQLSNYNKVLGCAEENEEDSELTPEEAAEAVQSNAVLAISILKLAEKKKVIDVGKNLQVSSDVVKDLHESIERTLQGIKELKSDVEGMEISEVALEKIRDYAGNLSLLCNMMLNGEDYDEEEKLKAILDVTTNDVNNMTAVEEVRESYDMQGGLTQGARGDSGPAGDNLRYFNYIDPDAEMYPGGTVGTNIRARKRFWKSLIKAAAEKCKMCGKKVLEDILKSDDNLHDHDDDVCQCDADKNEAFLGGGPQGSPTAEALPSGVGTVPNVGLHDNYTGTSSHMNQPSGAPGAPNGASPVMPAQPNLSS